MGLGWSLLMVNTKLDYIVERCKAKSENTLQRGLLKATPLPRFPYFELFVMEDGDNILDAIYEGDSLDDVDDDVDMVDVEEGELVEPDSQNGLGQSSAGDVNEANQEPQSKNRKRRANKKKNKKKRKGLGSNAMDIDRFVLDTCGGIKEKKSYMVYAAVGCLGISALSDLVKEVLKPLRSRAVKSKRHVSTVTRSHLGFRHGTIDDLIHLASTPTPNATKIMKKAKEFEKQFRQPNVKQRPVLKKEDSSGVPFSYSGRENGNDSDSGVLASQIPNQHEPATSEVRPISVRDRLRVPVSYDDDLLAQNPVNLAT
ncbi:hypothetical protein Fmac_000536 [Flemingia macrophylla]|uniref:Uncharacterized protein n=1 Tax=Flemingia macrophylla TaxID=520843 RepID=A0ABD1NEN2_9FABA